VFEKLRRDEFQGDVSLTCTTARRLSGAASASTEVPVAAPDAESSEPG
jgi:hypothetical protein